MLLELAEHQQSRRLELCSSLLLRTKSMLFWNMLFMWRKVNSLRQSMTSRWIFGPRRSSEAFPKAGIVRTKHHCDYLMLSGRFDPPQLPGSGRDHHSVETPWGSWKIAPTIALQFTQHRSCERCNPTSCDNARVHLSLMKTKLMNWDMKLDHPLYSSYLPQAIVFQAASRYFPAQEMLPKPKWCK